MRILLLTPLLLTAACNVSHDATNDEVTVQYNEEQARDTASDIGNSAENIGEAIANEAKQTGEKVNNSGIVADGDNQDNENANTADKRQ